MFSSTSSSVSTDRSYTALPDASAHRNNGQRDHAHSTRRPNTGREVTGFVITSAGVPTVYVSGDNASLDLVQAVAERLGPIDVAVLFAGAAQTALLGDAYLTLTSAQAAQAARILAARRVFPVHYNSWTHFHRRPRESVAGVHRSRSRRPNHLLAPGEAGTETGAAADARTTTG
jgi:L-ascorbate metabolism protein UlaG (beta-lactamase superfamily)